MKKKISTVVLFLFLIFTLGIMVNAATVKMNKTSATIQVGGTVQLQALVNGTAGSAAWGSSDSSVATVSSTGFVTGKAAGSSVITAMVNGNTVECIVSVVKQTTVKNTRYNVLIIDTSGSMKGTPLKRVKTAAKRFSKAVIDSDGNNYLAIVNLNSSAKVACKFTNKLSTLNKAINKLKASGETNMNKAFQVAGDLLDAQPSGAGVMKNIILCSDGLPQSGTKAASGRYSSSDHKRYQYANAVYKTDVALKNKDYFVYALGFFHNSSGKNLSLGKKLMKDLASKDKYFIVTKPTDIDDVFDNIAADINNVVISDTDIILYVGKTHKLRVKVNDKVSSAKWKSSDKSVATVNSSGKITAKKTGIVTITGTVKGQKVSCKVTVKKAPVSVSLDKKTVTLYVGTSVKLKATVTGTNSSVTWSSSKKGVASVKNGTVTGIKAGKATIKAAVKGKKATCEVQVKKPSVTIKPSSLTLVIGQSGKLTAVVNGPKKTVAWSSKDSKIASVDNAGNIEAAGIGTVQIIATANGVSKACTVTVTPEPPKYIYTVADLKNVAYDLEGTYYLMKDLNLGNEEWVPIGSNTTPFKGKFYGNGHTISNLYINSSAGDQGLFGVTAGALIQQLEVAGTVSGGTYTAGIVGHMTKGSKMLYCINHASVNGKDQVGGIVGRVSESTMEYCLNDGKVTFSGRGGGGITADIYPSGEIKYCVNMGDVAGGYFVGGITGGCTKGPITGCYNTGNVTGSSTKGAIAGDNASYAGTRTECYFLKTETVNAGYSVVGTGGTISSLSDPGLLRAIAAIKNKF